MAPLVFEWEGDLVHIRHLLLVICFATCLLQTQLASAQKSSSEIYLRRVLPLLRAPGGSSCQECHFSGIELGDFLSEDEADSFTRLRAGGWIDLSHPGSSKLLTFIARHERNTSVTIRELRKKESDALTQWIKLACENPDLLEHQATTDVGIELDAELIRYLRRDHVLSRFTDNIWSEMGRCIGCHSPERNQRQVEKHGDQMSWIVPHDPEATLLYMREHDLIDLQSPDDSMLRTKPTGLEEHGGGPKFLVGSESDKRFLRFLRDYARMHDDVYKTRRDLPMAPTERSRATEHFLRIVDLPEAWVGKLLRVDLHASNGDRWSVNRVATADGPVGKKRRWQSPLWNVRNVNQEMPRRMLPGRYRVDVSVDVEGRLAEDPDAELRASDFVGSFEIEAPWKPGFREPKIVDGSRIERRPDSLNDRDGTRSSGTKSILDAAR